MSSDFVTMRALIIGEFSFPKRLINNNYTFPISSSLVKPIYEFIIINLLCIMHSISLREYIVQRTPSEQMKSSNLINYSKRK